MTTQSHQGYRVTIQPADAELSVLLKGEVLAQSERALVMTETRQAPAYYFPREDVQTQLLTANAHTTHCPFKGDASYFDLASDGDAFESIAWSYEEGFDEASLVRDYIAFDLSKTDGLFEGDRRLEQESIDEIDDKSAAATNPLIDWLLKEAWKADSTPGTLEMLANALRESGVKLWRLKLFVRTLNPQLYGKFYTWQQDKDEVEEANATHKGMLSKQHLDSPYATIIAGEGGIRRCLESQTPQLDYPILEDLLEEGATDYVALPMKFSDGQINILSLVSNEKGGFSTSDLGSLYEILPHLGRLIEAHAQKDSALSLLQTYLGRNAGRRVLEGQIKRGDGEDIDAIIWFCDLRDSTRMADSMDRLTYLKGLDQYFDCVAGAIVTSGGEVLKFIGDAILAIFPIDIAENSGGGLEGACAQAVSALQLANEALAKVNGERGEHDLPDLRFGTGLHRGDITYGNIGAESRLDFTVIGPAVNEASRIEGLCKKLGEPVVTSAAFAQGLQAGKRSLGEYELAGVKQKWELFGLDL